MSNTTNVGSDFLRVLMALKTNIMKDINVCDIAIVKSISDEGVYCTMLNNSQTTVLAKVMSPLKTESNEETNTTDTTDSTTEPQLQVNDIVVVLYTNTDFRQNLAKLSAGEATYDVDSTTRHSKSFGVIIGTLAL